MCLTPRIAFQAGRLHIPRERRLWHLPTMDEESKMAALRAHADRQAYFRSLHEARLLDARAAINTALGVNSAASVAVLAFLGSLNHVAPAAHIPFDLIRSLGAFGFGVFSAASAATASYVANHQYAEATRAKADTWSHPYVEETEASRGHQRRAMRAHWIAYTMAVGMLLSFLAGVWYAADGLMHLR